MSDSNRSTEGLPAALPCPFCGGTNVSPTEGPTFRWMAAQCAECGATCGEVRVQTMGNGTPETWDAKAKVNAIMEWNKRSPGGASGCQFCGGSHRVANDSPGAPDLPCPNCSAPEPSGSAEIRFVMGGKVYGRPTATDALDYADDRLQDPEEMQCCLTDARVKHMDAVRELLAGVSPEPAGGQVDEGKVWSLLRQVLVIGGAIERDVQAGAFLSSNHLSAHLDDTARGFVDQFKAGCYVSTKEPKHGA